MDQTTRINAFIGLGKLLKNLTSQNIEELAQNARNENSWFTRHSIETAIGGIVNFLDEEKLNRWVSSYSAIKSQKTVALILAGNIPLVGFHDLLAPIISGHKVKIKLSSKDTVLTKFIINALIEIEPSFSDEIIIADQLKGFDAVIATGSDNSARYFEYYFGKYPHIIRKNRSSVAVLTGSESPSELEKLGSDVFTYYGLGCRNVSKILIPQGFDFAKLFEAWSSYSDVVNHHKYANNYDYQKSIRLIEQIPFLDNGFVMLQESEKLVSPISVVYYEYYQNPDTLIQILKDNSEKIQTIVGKTKECLVPFGESQCPGLNDYADNVDTMSFLRSIG